MSTECIKVTLEDNPLNVLKGCSCILSSLQKDFVDYNDSHHAIMVIADLLSDAVSMLDDKEQEKTK